ncbi:MAG: hypothetical protein DRO40_06930 [Thermoprotei archaeon]|nr:MAG: hypothetical protein DRO40_06930 [Thermoprotei archaeon]
MPRYRKRLDIERYWCEEPIIRTILWSIMARQGMQLYFSHNKGPLVFGRNDILQANIKINDKYTWGKFHVDIVAYDRDKNVLLVGNIASILYAWLNYLDLPKDFHEAYSEYVFCPPEKSCKAYEFLSTHDVSVKPSLASRMYKSIIVLVRRYGRIKRLINTYNPKIILMGIIPFYALKEVASKVKDCLEEIIDHAKSQDKIKIDGYSVYTFYPEGKIKDLPENVSFIKTYGNETLMPEKYIYHDIKSLVEANGCNQCRYKGECLSRIRQNRIAVK